MSPIRKKTSFSKNANIIQYARSDSVIEEPDQVSSFTSDTFKSNRNAIRSLAVGQHKPLTNSKFSLAAKKVLQNRLASKKERKPGFTLEVEPRKLPDFSKIQIASKPQKLTESRSSFSSRRSLKAIPNPQDYKPKYSLADQHDRIGNIHKNNLKKYPELYREGTFPKAGEKDQFYTEKGRVLVFNSDTQLLKEG